MNFSKNILNAAGFWLLISVLAVLVGCGHDDDRNTPDVSGIKVAVKIRRFDQDLFAIDTSNVEAGLSRLRQQYPNMLQLFTENIIHDQTNPKETPTEAVRGFITAPEVRKIYDTVQQVYGDVKWLEKDLSQPNILTMV